MKARIEENYLGKKANNITVITNGTKKTMKMIQSLFEKKAL